MPEPSAVLGYAESLCLALSVGNDLDKVSAQTVAAYIALKRALADC